MTKNRLKQFLYTYEIRKIGIISNSLVFRTPKIETLKQLKAEILYISRFFGLNNIEINTLWLNAYKTYNFVSKRVFAKLRKIGIKKQKEEGYAEVLRARQDVVYDVIRKEVVYKGQLELEKNKIANSVEHRTKHNEIRELLNNRASPLYLCSSHVNPAKDHAEWEGRVYYDEYWRDYISDPDEVARIAAYIANHNLKSVQWVTGAPVYLINRPNCRHYLIPIPVEEVLHSSRKSLLKRYKMYMPDKIPVSYEMQQYRGYYDRLKALVRLYEIAPSNKLAEDIKNTRMLVRSWRDKASRA